MSPGKPIPLVLKFADWPCQDRALWEAALREEGPFNAGGAFAHHREGTSKRYRQDYGHWLSYILRNRPDRIAAPPAERVDIEAVTGFITETITRPSGRGTVGDSVRHVRLRTLANHLEGLLRVMRAFDAPQDLSWLQRAARRIYAQSEPTSLKPPIPLSAAEIRAWALRRVAEVDKDHDADPIVRAVAYRQALSIGLLISAPERLRAFSTLTTDGVSIISDDLARLDFPAAATKNNRDRCIHVSGALVSWLRLYLDQYRQVLLRGASSTALWISRDGTALTYYGFAGGLELVMKREFGLPLRPHAFRAIAASSTAELLPEQVGIVREILGHATLEMAERHYIRTTNVRSSRSYQQVIAALRKSGPGQGKGPRQKR